MNSIHWIFEKRVAAILIAIIILGFALRLYKLGDQNLWLDEVCQVDTVVAIDNEGPLIVAQLDNVSPLSMWVLWLSTKFTGFSDAAARIPMVIQGTLAILLIYFVGKEIVSVRTGLVAAGFTAVSPFAIWYSQDNKPYALYLLLSLAYILLLFRCLKKDKTWNWIFLLIITILGIYTHQYMALLCLSSGIYLLYAVGLKDKRFWKWLFTQTIAAASFVPWLILAMERSGYSSGYQKGGTLLWPFYTLYTFFYGFSLGPSLRDLHWGAALPKMMPSYLIPHLSWLAPLAILSGILFFIGLIKLLKSKDKSALIFFLVILFGPILLATLMTFFTNISYNSKYVICSFPALIIIISAAVAETAKPRIVLIIAGIVLSGMIWSTINWYSQDRYAKEDIKSAASYLTNQVQPNDLVIISSGKMVIPLKYYGFIVMKDYLRVNPGNISETEIKIKNITKEQTKRIWHLESRAWESDPNHRLSKTLDATTLLAQEKKWPGVTVKCYVP